MVVKPLSHLVRRSTKVLAHHAQSITAASSTSTSQHFDKYTNNRFNRGIHQTREPFHTTAFTAAHAKPADHGPDGHLDSYLAAWQRHHHIDDWHQFQLTQRIGWKPAKSGKDSKSKDDVTETPRGRGTVRGLGAERTYSAGDAEAIKQSAATVPVSAEAEAEALAKIDEAIAQEIKEIHSTPEAQPAVEAADQLAASAEETPATRNDESLSSPVTVRSATPVSRTGTRTPLSSVESVDNTQYVDHLVYLEKEGSHAQIPAVFESLLRRGATPPAAAYNSLLAAAIRLPASSHQVVSKVLDVYADMLRRNVLPNQTTFTLVLEVLGVRALQVLDSKTVLDQSRARFGSVKRSQLLFKSQETEYEMLTEDDSLTKAIKVFNMATEILPEAVFSAGTYRVLIEACARHGEVDQMLRLHGHMESRGITPYASVYSAMVEAFAASGDLRSAVETYDGYKSMAMADDQGSLKLLDRADADVYVALAKGYLTCGKETGAHSFFDKLANEGASDLHKTRLEQARQAVIVDAFVKSNIESQQFGRALEFLEEQTMGSYTRLVALNRICSAAADRDLADVADRVYRKIFDSDAAATSGPAMLAMWLRAGDITAARNVWTTITALPQMQRSLVEPATAYAIALVGNGAVDEGLTEARQAFDRIRDGETDAQHPAEVADMIDEGIEMISSSLNAHGAMPSGPATMGLMWAMVENGGLLPGVAENLLAVLGPNEVTSLSWQDLKLALQVEAGIVGSVKAQLDVAHHARLAHLLETAIATRMPTDSRTNEIVERTLERVASERPDIVSQWRAYAYGMHDTPATPASPAVSNLSDTYDPHASSLDQRGSSIIVEELEKSTSNTSASLNEALARFKNIRRAGRHPRYIAYAKLIGAAAKDGRVNLINDLFGMAKQDVPLLPQYPVVRHGWASILDAMVGASLTIGNRQLAAEYHAQLREIGSAPSANTFGLYITTLKESTKTFDEATEAVKIFHQAKSEGVEPSSFLYNALIGKLGKARRIDDCLFYFAEMRSRGIRPTSVTYGTIVNALCRVSDERFAQELFDEMESMPNYKPRPAPYNSMMQFFLTTKRDSSKVLEYYQRMLARKIEPTMHTYKLLIDTHATLEPINLPAAEAILDTIVASGQRPEAVHYASLIHAKGCVMHDMVGARVTFDKVIAQGRVRPQACLYQALFESMVANHCVSDTESILADMQKRGVDMTPYIANQLIHGWALANELSKATAIYKQLGRNKREPSTYEAMTRAYLAAGDRESASEVVREMLSRGYPSAVSGKVLELLGHGIGMPPAATLAGSMSKTEAAVEGEQPTIVETTS
jgi:pentatricopeptide repeat protein